MDPAANRPSHTSLHSTHHRCTIADTLLALSGTSAGQYVFLPLATEYFPQTDHLSGGTVIHGCCFVCLCPWRRCRLIRLSPAHKITAASVSFLSPLLFYLFQSFTQSLQSLAACASSQSPLRPARSCIPNVHEYVFALAVLIPLTFQTPLLRPRFRRLCPFPPPLRLNRIERFPSLLPDLAVIVSPRSRQMDFSEKDTVVFGNLLLLRAN